MRSDARWLLLFGLLLGAGLACTIKSADDSTSDGGTRSNKKTGAATSDDSDGITKLGQAGMGAAGSATGMAGAAAGSVEATSKGAGEGGASAGAGGKGGGAGSASTDTKTPIPVKLVKLPTCDTELPLPSFSSDATLEAGKCYLISGNVSMSAGTLTVQPGAILEFKQGASLTVTNEGAISALGTADAPITFMGSITEAGHWLSLIIDSDNPKNELAFVQFAHGGSDAACCRTGRAGATLIVTNKSRASISDCSFTLSGRDAVELEPGSKLVKFERNQFLANQGAPVNVNADNVGKLDAASNYLGSSDMPNKTPYIVISESNSVSNDATWPETNVPYRALGGVAVDAKLTLSPGVMLEFPDDQGISVDDKGVLNAVGSKDEHISLHGTHVGKWLGMLITSSDDGNQLQFLDLDGGGSAAWCCDVDRGIGNLLLDPSAVVSIQDSSFTNGAHNGVYAMTGAVLKAFARNSFSKNHGNPISVTGLHLATIDASSTFKGGNDDDQVLVRGGTSDDGTWAALDVPYRIKGELHVGGDVVIAPGAKFAVDAGTGLWVDQTGTLSAITSNNDITFTGVNDQASFWLGIGFASRSDKNVLEGVTIDGAGSAGWCCNVDRKRTAVLLDPNAGATVRNSKLNRSGGYGIYTMSGAMLTQSGNTFSANTSADVGP